MANEFSALRKVFRSPDLRRLELAWFATSIGVWGSALALAIYAYDKGGASAVGITAMLRTLPGAPAAPLLALVADRRSRRSVLLFTNAWRAAVLVATAAAVAADASLAAVYVLVVVLAIAGPAYKPSQAALFPLLAATPAELSSANVAASMLLNLGFLIGSLAAGVLLAATSTGTVLLILAGAFAASLIPLFRIARDQRPKGDPDARPVRDAVEGFRVVGRDPELRLLVGVVSVLTLVLGAMDVLVVVAALGLLGIGQAGAGYLTAIWGLGAIAGGAWVLGLLGGGRLTMGLTLGSLVLGGSVALIGLVPTLAVALVALFLFGAGDTLVDVAATTLLQRLAADHVLSRVFGVVETLYVIALALGSVGAGLLVDAIGTRGTLLVVGALLPAVVLLRRSPLSRYEAGAPVPGREYGLLRGNRIFAPLPVATAERLARNLVEVRPDHGAEVIAQGELGDRFYLVAEGELDVFEDEAYRRRMGPGDGFGEIALLRDIPRTATVRANSGVVLLALERAPFIEAVTGQEQSKRVGDSLVEQRMGPIPSDPASG